MAGNVCNAVGLAVFGGPQGDDRGLLMSANVRSLKHRGTEDAEVRILPGDDGVPCGWIEVKFDEERGSAINPVRSGRGTLAGTRKKANLCDLCASVFRKFCVSRFNFRQLKTPGACAARRDCDLTVRRTGDYGLFAKQYKNSCRFSPLRSPTRRKIWPPQMAGLGKESSPTLFSSTRSNFSGVGR